MAHVYYPSCKVRLLVRFEDFKPSPTAPSQALGPGAEADGGTAFNELRMDIVPFNCSVTRNSYREADTASVTIPFKAFPLDPRIIRAASISIFCGSISPTAYAEGMGPGGQGLDAALTLVEDSQDPSKPSASNEVFRGFVDTVEIEQDGDDTITLACRDQTAVFLDSEVGTQGMAGIPKDLPLDQVIQQIILGEAIASTLPGAAPMKGSIALRQTSRGKKLALSKSCNEAGIKLAALTAALPTELNPALIARATEEIARLTAFTANCSALLAPVVAEEASLNALPLLAQRFGIPGVRGMQVVNETRYPIMPRLGELKGVKWFDSKKTTKKAPSSGSNERINYWDLITDLCVSSGFICYLRPARDALVGGVIMPPELVITEPRTYYGERLPNGELPDPRASAPAEVQDLHEFAFGINADTVQIRRNLVGKAAPTTIQMNGKISETGEIISVRYPPTDKDPTGAAPTKANRVTPSGIGDKEEVSVMLYKGTIPQARAEEVLSLIAEKTFEELARGEFTVIIRTKEMMFKPSNVLRETVNRNEVVADVFSLQAGDSIRVGTVTHTPDEVKKGQITQAGLFKAMSLPERIIMLTEVYKFKATAAVLAAEAYENAAFPEVFRVTTVGIDFDHNEGFDFEIQAVNYLDVRNALDAIGA